MHTYSVALTVVGDIPEEDDISKRLGFRATSFFRKGQQKSPTRQWEQSVWSLEVQPSTEQREWDTIEEGLNALLDLLLPVKLSIEELKKSFKVLISCGQFASGFGAGPSLSHALLKSLASLELDLTISTYWHEDSESQPGARTGQEYDECS